MFQIRFQPEDKALTERSWLLLVSNKPGPLDGGIVEGDVWVQGKAPSAPDPPSLGNPLPLSMPWFIPLGNGPLPRLRKSMLSVSRVPRTKCCHASVYYYHSYSALFPNHPRPEGGFLLELPDSTGNSRHLDTSIQASEPASHVAWVWFCCQPSSQIHALEREVHILPCSPSTKSWWPLPRNCCLIQPPLLPPCYLNTSFFPFLHQI